MTTSLVRAMVVAASIAAAGVAAAQMPVEGPVTTHATVRVESKHGAEVQPNALKVEVDGRAAELISVRRVVPARAQVAILIDNGLRTSFGNQVDDVKKFVLGLPAGTQVLVGYMQNGMVITEGGGFSTEHEDVARKVHIPLAAPGVSASPYFCLSDFVKKWPSASGGPRFVLMLTNGVDPYNGSTSILNQNSPYVEEAQNDAQRAGVAVYAIYYGDAGIGGRSASFSGQSYLQQVAEATGGKSLWNGVSNPVSLQPFLEEFRKSIEESYVVSFSANAHASRGKDLTRFKITSAQPGVKVYGPAGVRVGQ